MVISLLISHLFLQLTERDVPSFNRTYSSIRSTSGNTQRSLHNLFMIRRTPTHTSQITIQYLPIYSNPFIPMIFSRLVEVACLFACQPVMSSDTNAIHQVAVGAASSFLTTPLPDHRNKSKKPPKKKQEARSSRAFEGLPVAHRPPPLLSRAVSSSMGTVCCRCQQVAFEDDALRFNNANAASLRRVSDGTSPLPRGSQLHRTGRRHRRVAYRHDHRRRLMNQSLSNYVSFPFPFASKLKAQRFLDKKEDFVSSSKTSNVQQVLRSAWSIGDHWTKTADGKFTPLSLMELCVRNVCAGIACSNEGSAGSPLTKDDTVPSEVASALVAWLKRHDALTKPSFRRMARLLFHDWDLQGVFDLESSWFDDIPATPLQHLRYINVSRCPSLESLGSDHWIHVDELPNLTVASFEGCTRLANTVPDILQSSARLTSLNLAGCRNIDDRSLLALRRLFRLQSLNLSGCHKVTDEGFKCLTSLSKMEKLVLSRCTQLTDDAFQDVELAFPMLKLLDVSHCRLTDVALDHFSHVTTLVTLVIRGCRQVGDIGVERLSTLRRLEYFDARHCEDIRAVRPEWTRMRVLLLGRSAFAESEAALLQSMDEIIELDLRSCRVLKRSFEFIGKLQHLERLNIAETSLTDAALVQIYTGTEALKHLVHLEILHLDTAGITNRSLVNLSGLTKLRELDLFSATITDHGVAHLAAIKQLEHIELCGGRLTDRGVEGISRLGSLKSLNISQNRNVTASALRFIKTMGSLEDLNLSNTGVTAKSLLQLDSLKELKSLSVYGIELSKLQIENLQAMLPKLKVLRCA